LKKILANIGLTETRVAVLEDGKLVELHYEREHHLVGNIYKGRVKDIVPAMDCAFVDIGLARTAFLHVSDVEVEQAEAEGEHLPISKLLKPGQELVVQVTKEPLGSKGARVTTRLALPARFLVLMPGADAVGVSRKIESAEERARLRAMAEKLKPKQMGLIVRTEAEGAKRKDLQVDLRFLRKTWRELQAKARKESAPVMLYQDVSLLYSVIRDTLSADVEEFIIDSEEDYTKACALVKEFAPELEKRIKKHRGKQALFEKYGLEEEIEKLFNRRVWLKSGGNLTIDETEALVAIDVNSAKCTSEKNLAKTVFKTNLEACEEIGRQLRLRQLGGQLVIDFIDMASAQERKQVLQKLKEVLKRDRAKTRVVSYSSLGLVEMTRKRTGESLYKALTTTCPLCEGRGRLKAPATLAGEIVRKLEAARKQAEGEISLVVNAHPDVCAALLGEGEEGVLELQRSLEADILLHPDADLPLERYSLTTVTLPKKKKRRRRSRKKSTASTQAVETEGGNDSENGQEA